VGDSVDVNGESRRIVGTAVFPAAGLAVADHSLLGVGAWMDGPDFEQVTSEPPETSTNAMFLSVRPGADVDDLVMSFGEEY